MRVSYYVQLIAFGLGLTIPISILITRDLPSALFLVCYCWGIGILAALWDRYTWRRKE